MPHDIEIMIAFRGPKEIIAGARALGMVALGLNGTEVPVPDDFSEIDDLVFPRNRVDEIERELRTAHTNCMSTVKARILPEDLEKARTPRTGRFPIEDQKESRVEVDPFLILFCYDPDEVGDGPEDATLGVSLNGRYHAVLLDLATRGSLPTAYDIGEHWGQIRDIQSILEEHIPGLRGARILLRNVFY